MASMQTLEGSSSLTFPQQFGYRRAREILMLDAPIRAEEAVACNFANGIIDDLGDEFFDISKVPAIGKMLNTDYRTLMEAKKLLNDAKDMEHIEKTITHEMKSLVDNWMEPEFPAKLVKFMKQLAAAKAKKRAAKL